MSALTDDVLDLDQAAALLKVTKPTVRQLAGAFKLPGRRVGNRWRFSRRKLIEWLEAGEERECLSTNGAARTITGVDATSAIAAFSNLQEPPITARRSQRIRGES